MINTSNCIIINVYVLAIMSSAIIPTPPLSFSTFLAGAGLTMSKILQIKNAIKLRNKLFGKNNNDIHIPTTSSIVHSAGSFPNFFQIYSQ